MKCRILLLSILPVNGSGDNVNVLKNAVNWIIQNSEETSMGREIDESAVNKEVEELTVCWIRY